MFKKVFTDAFDHNKNIENKKPLVKICILVMLLFFVYIDGRKISQCPKILAPKTDVRSSHGSSKPSAAYFEVKNCSCTSTRQKLLHSCKRLAFLQQGKKYFRQMLHHKQSYARAILKLHFLIWNFQSMTDAEEFSVQYHQKGS